MKISLTLAEIKSMVAREYVLPDEFDLEIVETPQEETDDGWISNIGRDRCGHPDSLSPDTQIVVKYRYGDTKIGFANSWYAAWCEIDSHKADIVAYRVIK